MPLATVEDVLEETGASYDDFGFNNDRNFQRWISKKITWVDNKIKGMVGAYYTNSLSIPDLFQSEVYWVYYKMLQRKHALTTASVESGFAIGSLRIDSGAGAAERLMPISEEYFKKVRFLLLPYTNNSIDQFLIAEDLDE
jgi:hypothetical protein